MNSKKTWGAALLAAALLAGCGKDEGALLSEARQFQQKGDAKSAAIQLKNLLQKNPDHAEARYLLGVIYQESGDVKSAEKELRKALELRADPLKVWPALGKSLLMQGEAQKVLDEMKSGENSPDILTVRGMAQLALGQTAEAKSSFEQALRLQPDAADALLGQARIAALEKNTDNASALIEQAIARNPGNLDAWLLKGDLQRLLGNDDAAVAAYRKAVELRPDHIPAWLNMASIQIAARKYEEAKQSIAAVRKVAPGNPIASYLQALADFRQGNFSAAHDAVQQVLKAAPTHYPSVLLAGAVEYALGMGEQAEQHLKWAVEKMPANLYARKLLVAALIKSRQLQRAREVLQDGLKRAPDDPALLALAGEIAMQDNDFSKATQYFEKAAALDPKNAGMRTSLGLSRLASGETERAVSELESAADLDSGQYQADILLIMSHIRRNAFDLALAAIAKLEKKQPDNPLTHNLRAACYIGKQDFAAARRSLEKALALQPVYFPAAMNLAQLDLREKKPDAARKRFEAVLEKDKDSLPAMMALANLAAAAPGRAIEAMQWLERARKAHPGAPQPAVELAKRHLQAGDAMQAVTVAQEAQASNPDNPEVLDVLGVAQLNSGHKNEALTTFTKLAALQPKSPLAQYRLASAQMVMENQAGAIMALKKALDLKPDYLEAQVALVGLELRAGHVSEALKIAGLAQKQSPKSPAGFVLEGDVLMADKKPAPAVKAYETAFDLGKGGALVMKLHAAYREAGKPQEGEAKLLQWLKEVPDDATVRLYLADAYLKTERIKAAVEQYEWIVKKQPQNLVALNNLAWAYQQIKDPRALQYAEQAYKLKPDSVAVMDTLGWMLVEQGKAARGTELLQKAVSLAPDAQEVRYHLAQAWLKAGDKARARQELERVLGSGTKFPQEAEATALLRQLKN